MPTMRVWGVIILVLVIALSFGSGPFCLPNDLQQNASPRQQGSQESCPSLNGVVISAAIDFAGRNSNEISAAITALATIAIAAFTGTLWWATSGMLRAAEEQAELTKRSVAAAANSAAASMRSAIATEKLLETGERPYIFVFGVKRLEIDSARVGGFQPFLSYVVANYGKTPAVITDVGIGFSVGAEPGPPNKPEETYDLFASPILTADERRPLHEELPYAIDSTLHRDESGDGYAIPAVEAGQDVFFRVLLHYRGAFTEGHESSFCWRYDKSTAHFVQYGGNDYNYVA